MVEFNDRFCDTPPTTTAEWLCYFLRTRGASQSSDKPDIAASNLASINWDDLVQFAGRHGLTSLLYDRLRTAGFLETVPHRTCQTLHTAYLQSAGRNMRLYHQLAGVLHEFHKRGIPVIVLKGAYLAEAVYRNIALRPMCDIDLLVKPTDVVQAGECLTVLGYQPSHPFRPEALLTFGLHLPPFFQQGRVPIEIHWRLVAPDSPFMYDSEELWNRAQPVSISGGQAYGLAPEHLALHLCLHAAYSHNWASGLLPLCDLTVLCETYQPAMDYEQLVSTARQWNAEKSLYLGLYFARALFQADIPDTIVQAVQPTDVAPQWLDWLQMRLLNPGEQFPTHLVKLAGARGLRAKLAMIWKRMFLSPEEMGCLYDISPDSPAIYLRYPHRIWIQLKRYAPTVWRLARHDPALTAAGDQKHAFREWLTTPNRQETPLNLP